MFKLSMPLSVIHAPLFRSLKVVSDACWALSYVTDGNSDRIQAVIDAQVTSRLVQLLSTDDMNWVVGAIIQYM